jgi:hypothetical protein
MMQSGNKKRFMVAGERALIRPNSLSPPGDRARARKSWPIDAP